MGALFALGHLRFQVLNPNLKELGLCKMSYVAICAKLDFTFDKWWDNGENQSQNMQIIHYMHGLIYMIYEITF